MSAILGHEDELEEPEMTPAEEASMWKLPESRYAEDVEAFREALAKSLKDQPLDRFTRNG
jgi:hypothetical protein